MYVSLTDLISANKFLLNVKSFIHKVTTKALSLEWCIQIPEPDLIRSDQIDIWSERTCTVLFRRALQL